MHVNKLRTSAPGFSFKRKGMNSVTCLGLLLLVVAAAREEKRDARKLFFGLFIFFLLSFPLFLSPGQVPDLRRGAGIWCRVNCKKQKKKTTKTTTTN